METGVSVGLVDDGTRGDETAGDGLYSATITLPDQGGYNDIRVWLETGESTRVRMSGVYRYASAARVTAVGTMIPESPDGDGRWQSLRVPVTVEANNAGEGQVRANLRDSTGQLVATTSTRTPLVAGSQELMLRFDGATIHDAQRDGPFIVTDLSIQGTIAGEPVGSSSDISASSDSTLTWRQFTGEVMRLSVEPVGGIERGQNVTTVVFRAALTTELQGTYGWTAVLVDEAGLAVASISDQFTANPGEILLPLRFPVDETQSAILTSLRLHQVIVWREGGTSRLVLTEEDGLATVAVSSAVYLPLVVK